jgi:hypothetical protein
MNSDAFLRGFMSRFEKLAVQLGSVVGPVHTGSRIGSEIPASEPDYKGSDPKTAKTITDLRRQGVRGKIPTDPKGLARYKEMAEQYRRSSMPVPHRR